MKVYLWLLNKERAKAIAQTGRYYGNNLRGTIPDINEV
jgi:hypothetical protein